MTDPVWVDQLPALLIAIPILAAVIPLILGIRWDQAGWSVAAIITVAMTAGSVILARTVYRNPSSFGDPSVVHELGGFPRPVGIELVADELSTAVVLLVTFASLGTLVFIRRAGPHGPSFYSAYLLLLGGLNGVILTGDVFNLFVFLEITGIATYALIAKGRSGESAVAALKYLIIGTVGASLYLVGVGLVFLATGTLNMIDLATAIPETAGYDHALVNAAFAFIFVGFAIKVAQWPMHTWQPDAYQRAPDGVTILIAALVSTASAYALIRVAYTVFTVEFFISSPHTATVVVVLGSISVMAGAILAVIQQDIKRMFAYSSVSQFGLVVVAVGLINETALLGGIVHLLGHGIMKGGLFLAAAVIAFGIGARTVDEYAGLAARRPVEAAAIAILGITLIGIPPSIGFIGKWLIAVGAVEAGAWPVAVVVFLSTLLTLGYIARLLEKMYFTPQPTHVHERSYGDHVATDGGNTVADMDRSDVVTVAMLVVVVLTAVLAVGLGFAGAELEHLFDPYVSGVMDR